VVHHDVRPANLIIRPGPHTVLIDLGAAETPDAPRRRAIYGATGWLPPERLAASPAPASPLVDIYAVGALLHVLTNDAKMPTALAALIAEATAADPQRRGAALPTMDVLALRLETIFATLA
jgi:serine/threonine protein kinase